MSTGVQGQPYKYNSIELERHFGLEINDAFYRTDDPQTGRFWQIDPKYAYHLSPYSSRANNPVLYSDPLGDTTQIYGKNGILFGTVNDNLPNQIHFLSIDADKDKTPWTLSDGKTVDANAWGKTFRDISTAFIGEKSVKSLKKMALQSANIDDGGFESGRETGFYGVISDTKEIIFKEFTGVKGTSDEFPMGDALRKFREGGGNTGSIYALGHSHTKGWLRQIGNGPNSHFDRSKMLQYYARPSGSPGTVDYYPQTGANIPLIITSPVGLTIYGSQKYYDYKRDVYNYDSFKK